MTASPRSARDARCATNVAALKVGQSYDSHLATGFVAHVFGDARDALERRGIEDVREIVDNAGGRRNLGLLRQCGAGHRHDDRNRRNNSPRGVQAAHCYLIDLSSALDFNLSAATYLADAENHSQLWCRTSSSTDRNCVQLREHDNARGRRNACRQRAVRIEDDACRHE